MVCVCVCVRSCASTMRKKKNVLRRPTDGHWDRRALPNAQPSEIPTTCVTILLLLAFYFNELFKANSIHTVYVHVHIVVYKLIYVGMYI